MSSCNTDRCLLLRLPRASLARRDAIRRLASPKGPNARSLFAFHCDELAFARALLARRTNLWLYRSNQRAYAGDFIVVDVSSPLASSRPVVVVELKRGRAGAAARIGQPSSVQLRNAPAALLELTRTGVIGDASPVRAITGDVSAVLAYLSQSIGS